MKTTRQRDPASGRANPAEKEESFGTWQFRYIDWFRDLGFLGKPGVETKAAKDVATRAAQPQRGQGGAR